jgi:hypothetical protein
VDLRLEALNLIDRDPVLRALRVNHAIRLQLAGPSNATANGECFLVLTWTSRDQLDVPIGTEVLTARVHLPRPGWSALRCLDMVLQRLEEALTDEAAERLVTSRCVGGSRQVSEGDGDTIFGSRTFEIAPARSRVDASRPLHLSPWRACTDPGFADLSAAGPRGPHLN